MTFCIALTDNCSQRKTICAQDKLGRDVIMKIVEQDSDEYRICQELLEAEELFQPEFGGLLPPIAILDTDYSYSFVVMPR